MTQQLPPELDLNASSYRVVEKPKASRLNAILVLCICFVASLLPIILAIRDPIVAMAAVVSAIIGIAAGWAITRIADPKPYIAEDDPSRLKNPAPKTIVGRFVSRPAGWDAPGAWRARIIGAICLGLVAFWIRSHY